MLYIQLIHLWLTFGMPHFTPSFQIQ